MAMSKLSQPRLLSKLFPLYRRNYILHDSEGDFWLFTEKTDNSCYARYSLTGRTLGDAISRSASAFLFCKFLCRDAEQSEVSAFIEDIVTAKRGQHIGTWMVNRLIGFLRQAEGAVYIDRVYGDFLQDQTDNAAVFFKRFGFGFKVGQNNRHIISAALEDLKTLALPDLKEIPVEEAIREWFRCISKTL